MPRKFRARKARKGKRSAKGRHMTVSATRSLAPIPARFITKHKYSETFSLALSNSYQYKYNLNGMYDPNSTGGGHQPYGYDQLATLYNRYRVIKCSYTISGIQSDSPGTNTRLVAVPSNAATTFTTVSEACETPRAKFIVQGAAGSPLKTLHGWSYIPSLMGRSKAEYMADDRYQATNGSNPSELAILNIVGGTLGDVGTSITAVITLEYTCEWFDLNQLAQS